MAIDTAEGGGVAQQQAAARPAPGQSRQEALQRLMDSVIASTGAERGFLLLNMPGRGLQFAAARDFKQEEVDHPRFAACRTLIDFVVETGEPQIVDDALTDSRTAASESAAALGLRSVIVVPLKSGDEVVGVIYLDHRHEAGRFNQSELQVLEEAIKQASATFASLAAAPTPSAQPRPVAGSDAQATLDTLLDTLNSMVVVFDKSGRVKTVNRAAGRVFKLSPEEAAGRGYKAILGDELAQKLLEPFKVALRGEQTNSLLLDATVNERRRLLSCEVGPLLDGAGATAGVMLVVDDQTPRYAAEAALKKFQAEHQRVRDLFSQYVPAAVVKKLIDNPQLATEPPKRREVTILFADIRGFTTLSENSHEERVLLTLRRYFTVAVEAIMEHGGTLDKFIGDGIMAIFNSPEDLPNHAFAAVKAGWTMQAKAARFMEGVSFGVGVNTGTALVGNIGVNKITNYSCIGDVVNVASRLQGQASGGDVIITDRAYKHIQKHNPNMPFGRPGGFRFKDLGGLHVKGRTEPVRSLQILEIPLDA
ncbi:MAG TPA: adenylate/guanylate cyclase domain-containing protein [Chloroflexota bacterium]|nr:adenylate/guanylate cyclase domain-containing protein [Chloroflexota bacterium]